MASKNYCSGELITCDKLDQMANWFGASVATAFFSSLEKCYCINLSTTDTDEFDEEEAKDRPLMLTKPINHDAAGSVSASASAAATEINGSSNLRDESQPI